MSLAPPPAAASGVPFETAISAAGLGPFQWRLLAIFGLVWTADAMQVLAIGFTAPSIAASFGLTIPAALQTGTVFFLGMLIGASVFGRLADRYGRRNVLIVTVLIDAVCGLASVFAPDFTWLLILRFMTGVGVGGTLPVDYAMMAEFLPANRRGRWLVMLEGFWAVGTILVALVSWGAQQAGAEAPWRIIFLATAAPAFVGLFLRLWIPESPLFLSRTGRTAEADAVLARVARANGNPPPPPVIGDSTPRAPIGALLKAPLGRTTLLILAAWLLVSMSYYGVFVWLPSHLAGQGFGFVRGQLFLVLVAVAQVPGYALAAYGVEKWGRRPTLIGFLVLSALGCMLYAIAGTPGTVAAAMLVMSFALLGTWGALYAFTPEIFPTTLRATGMGAAGATARLGGLLAPSLMAPIVTASFALALGLFSGLLLIAAVAVALIRVETRDKPLS
ncbi:MFS transporter [Terrihabitans rhizophilus]|jgi:putative MFS transporter|uniref:MFS transporter n=1 Tax=Terrihabitans rhizophilus TaxID=3092662 RepID=A0ABU4RQ75_9HYPH|nr:MFS transporter [Terrihabitans sp. PJ23]MDX6805825.1 MFS transporter [Terrihabitans sp. PJ23]